MVELTVDKKDKLVLVSELLILTIIIALGVRFDGFLEGLYILLAICTLTLFNYDALTYYLDGTIYGLEEQNTT